MKVQDTLYVHVKYNFMYFLPWWKHTEQHTEGVLGNKWNGVAMNQFSELEERSHTYYKAQRYIIMIVMIIIIIIIIYESMRACESIACR